ncbi:MAG: GDSL-type esterase/lipase family protein [Kofleriaceae bacterium]
MPGCAPVRSLIPLVFALAVADAAPARELAATLDNTCLDKGCTRHALDHFDAALAAQRSGKATHTLRVSYFGDSLTADDHITHALREKLGALVGEGGPGFVFAAPPHPYCQHRAVSRIVGGDWQIHGVSMSPPLDHLIGLGGSAEGTGSIRLASTAPVTSVDIHFLAQPRGGTLAVLAGGKLIEQVATLGDRKRAGFAKVGLPEGTTKIELRAAGRVRLFGAALEATRGAVVDNLGVVNATAKAFNKNNLKAHWRHQLAHRDSDLVIVMLGTNEAGWLQAGGAGMAEHEHVFSELLASVRAGNQNASCLVVSPLDQMDYGVGKLVPRASIPAMVDAQRRAAAANGGAFWDVYQWMGGKGASLGWFKRGLVIKDFQHPTWKGAARLADALYRGLVR